MKRSLYAVLTVLLLLTACGQGVSTSGGASSSAEGLSWQEQYDLGIRYLSEGKYEEAILAFTAAIEIDPKQAPAYVGRGDAHTGVARLAAGDAAELPEEAVGSYKSAVADYLAAIDLDAQTAEVYLKAAEVYVALGDIDAALDILSRGVEATGDQSLQDYLDELGKEDGPVYLLIRQSGYKPDGTIIGDYRYTYDGKGYVLTRERDINGDIRTDTWNYSGAPGHSLYIPDRQSYRSEEEWLAAQKENTMKPGSTGGSWTHSSGGLHGEGYSVHTDPLFDEEKRAAVLENGGILTREASGGDSEGWAYAVYTFDEAGNPVNIVTYNDAGSVTGTAIFEWEFLEPTDTP